MSQVIYALSATILVVAHALLALKLWHWYDTYKDWVVIRDAIKKDAASAIYKQAWGFMLLAHVRVVDGFFFAALGGWNWMNRDVIPSVAGYPAWFGRAVFIAILLMEVVKLLIDRRTRIAVYRANL